MNENYSIFRSFPSVGLAVELQNLLSKNGVDYELADNLPSVDVTFSGNTVNDKFEIRIDPKDFEKAENILEKDAENIINEIDPDYYLFQFTNDELYEILLKSDEWNAFDYTLAQKILTERGKSIDKDLLNSLKTQRLKELSKPEDNQKPWIVAGYIFALLGGYLGLIIGYFLWTSKKTLPNGQKIYSYSEKDRKQGKIIFTISLVIVPISL
ncbi:MAG TPA: hypothetical protein EYO76_04860, partial [Flavobacteriaceae bacterium]|nr:hypothetical protein [Flavobacteriaceae bacterium]